MAKGVLTSLWGSDTIVIMPKIVVDTGEIYSAADAAQEIGIGYATLYRWIKKEKIIVVRLVGRTLVPKTEVERIKRERAAEAAALSGSRPPQKPQQEVIT